MLQQSRGKTGQSFAVVPSRQRRLLKRFTCSTAGPTRQSSGPAQKAPQAAYFHVAVFRMSARIFISVILLWPLAACSERPENSYSSFAEAQVAGAIERGWVPGWLPMTASAITEAHDLDTNRFMVRFSFPPQSQVSLPASCTRISPSSPPPAPFSRKWWPADVPANHLATHRHAFYQCGSVFTAIATSLGEGFSWQP